MNQNYEKKKLLRNLLLPLVLLLSACGSAPMPEPEVPSLSPEQLEELQTLACQVDAIAGFVPTLQYARRVVDAIRAMDAETMSKLLAEANVPIEKAGDLAAAWNACGGSPIIDFAPPAELQHL